MTGREKILKVAEDLFVEKGFIGTSMNEIAERAGVAKSLIYHHFDSKKALWLEMIRNYHDKSGLLETFYDTIPDGDPDNFVELLTGRNGFVELLRNNPRMVRLFSWLNLEQEFEPEYPEDEIKRKTLERIRELQRDGFVRSDIEPGIIPIIFLSVVMHWFSARWSLAGWMGTGTPEEDIDDAYLGVAIDILLRGIEPDAKA